MQLGISSTSELQTGLTLYIITKNIYCNHFLLFFNQIDKKYYIHIWKRKSIRMILNKILGILV